MMRWKIGRSGAGCGVDGAAAAGAGDGKERRGGEADGEPFPVGAGSVERRQPEIDRDGGGFSGRHVRLQAGHQPKSG